MCPQLPTKPAKSVSGVDLIGEECLLHTGGASKQSSSPLDTQKKAVIVFTNPKTRYFSSYSDIAELSLVCSTLTQ